SEFAQAPIGQIWSGRYGCHTYNRRSGLEVIDLFGHIRGLREVTTSYWPLASDAPTSGALGQPLIRPIQASSTTYRATSSSACIAASEADRASVQMKVISAAP